MFNYNGILFANAEQFIKNSCNYFDDTILNKSVFCNPYEYVADANSIFDSIDNIITSINSLISSIENSRIEIMAIDENFSVDYKSFFFGSNSIFFSDNKIVDKYMYEGNSFINSVVMKNTYFAYLKNMDIYGIEPDEELLKSAIFAYEKDNTKLLSEKLNEIGDWYVANVNTYQARTSGSGSGGRKYYTTPFGTREFGDDCTEFAVAYMSYVCGKDLKETYSAPMVNPNGIWAQNAKEYGWVAYSSDDIGYDLKTGDVLVARDDKGYNSGNGYIISSKGKHAEVYIDEDNTFGWGQIQKQYPLDRKIEIKEINGHIHYFDNSHDYVTVYRYEG